MSDTKIFRVPYYPNQAYLDFSQLEAEEIGVLMQIVNLIYMKQGPIENNGKWIARSINEMSTAKCNNIIKKLIKKGSLFIHNSGEFQGSLGQKMCETQLKLVQNSRETMSKLQQNSVKSRMKNKQNQEDDDSVRNNSRFASISISDSIRDIPPNPQGGTGGNYKPKTVKGKKRHGKSNLAEQASKLLDKYADQKPDKNDDCLL